MARDAPPYRGGKQNDKRDRSQPVFPSQAERQVLGSLDSGAEPAGLQGHCQQVGIADRAHDRGDQKRYVAAQPRNRPTGIYVEPPRFLSLDDGVGRIDQRGNETEGRREGEADREWQPQAAEGGGELLHARGRQEDEPGGHHRVQPQADGEAVQQRLAADREGTEPGDLVVAAKHQRPEDYAEDEQQAQHRAQPPEIGDRFAGEGGEQDRAGDGSDVRRMVEGNRQPEGGGQPKELDPGVEPVEGRIPIEIEVHAAYHSALESDRPVRGGRRERAQVDKTTRQDNITRGVN